MGEPTSPEVSTEALIAEAEDLRQRLRIETEQKEHYQREAIRLGNLAREAQEQLENAEDKFAHQAKELAEAQRSLKAQYALLMGHRTQLEKAKAEIANLQARLSATETHG